MSPGWRTQVPKDGVAIRASCYCFLLGRTPAYDTLLYYYFVLAAKRAHALRAPVFLGSTTRRVYGK
jgi:hypothetical protein